MKIRYNLSEIMHHARQIHRDAIARRLFGEGANPLTDFGYCLKQAWHAAKAERVWALKGVTAGFRGFILVMEG